MQAGLGATFLWPRRTCQRLGHVKLIPPETAARSLPPDLKQGARGFFRSCLHAVHCLDLAPITQHMPVKHHRLFSRSLSAPASNQLHCSESQPPRHSCEAHWRASGAPDAAGNLSETPRSRPTQGLRCLCRAVESEAPLAQSHALGAG